MDWTPYDWTDRVRRAIALEVDDMEKAVTYLRTRGVKITRKPAKLATSLCAEVEDPDGLSIELRQWLKQGVASKVILRSETTKNPLSDGDSRDSSLRSE